MFNLVVFIDLKKSFDTINHDILLKKLEFYGIKGQALDLLKSYLSNRHQKCQVESFVSSEHLVKCGVPQGYILGPLLFLLYCILTTYPSVLKIQDLRYSLMIQTSQPLLTLMPRKVGLAVPANVKLKLPNNLRIRRAHTKRKEVSVLSN